MSESCTEAYFEVWAGNGGWVCGICGRQVESGPCPVHVGMDVDPLFSDDQNEQEDHR